MSYGSALWFLSSPSIRTLEVSFNKFLQRIWRPPARCHTTIVHHTARVPSLFNVIHSCSLSLLHSADLCPSRLVKCIFRQSSLCSFTFSGYNILYGHRYLKYCDTQNSMPCVQMSSAVFDWVDIQMLILNIILDLFHVTNITMHIL